MRSSLRIIGLLALVAVTACTTKNAEPPPLAGPSGLATTILMVADKDILTQNGLDEAVITVQALGPNGESRNVNLRAQILVEGVPQDYGTLSTKTLTTPTVIRYRAPAAATLAGAQIAQSVTIAVTPIGDDFNGQVSRTIEIRLVPQGIILPSNPALLPSFTVSPDPPVAFATATFDASLTTNRGVACPTCSFAWNFGDGTTGTGMQTTHQFRSSGAKSVALTVTDVFGASNTFARTLIVGDAPAPTAVFVVSPSGTVGVNQDVFFNASTSAPAPGSGRTIVRYDWNFGDGDRGTGVTTTHRYRAVGNYQVQLVVTDDVGTIARSQPASISVAGGGPTVTATATPSSQVKNAPITFNVTATPSSGSTIVSYKFNYGDGSEETGSASVQTHTYSGPGTFPVTITVTDSLGRSTSITISVTIT